MSKVPETLQAIGQQHSGKFILVSAPEQLLVRLVTFGQSLVTPAESSPQCNHKQEKGDAGQHVYETWCSASCVAVRDGGK